MHGLTSQKESCLSDFALSQTRRLQHSYLPKFKSQRGMCFCINDCFCILKAWNRGAGEFWKKKSCNILIEIVMICNWNIIIWNFLYMAVFFTRIINNWQGNYHNLMKSCSLLQSVRFESILLLNDTPRTNGALFNMYKIF